MRYLRLLLLMLRVSIQNDAAYRLDFLLQIGGSLIHVGAMLVGLWVIYDNTSEVNGWSFNHMLALVGVFRAVSGAVAMLIAPNMRLMMEEVRTGALDFALLRPVNNQFYVSVRKIAVWRVADVLVGLAVAAVGAWRLSGAIPLAAVLTFLLTLTASLVIVYSIWLMLATTSFWLVRVQNIEMIFWNVFEAARYPVSIYGQPLRWILTYVLPVAFVVTVPAQALVGGAAGLAGGIPGGTADGVAALGPWAWVAAGIAAPVMLAAATAFWRFGLRHYSGASA